jgi:Leucine-rich repeat (LRR) protein
MEITEFNSAPVRLDLEGNWFVDFPEALRDFFESIEHLDLAANRITEIPDWVADEGRDLEELLLGANCITRVRVALSELPNLETVDLSDNAIVEISRRAFGSGRLDVIKLAGNRLASMPPIVWPRHVLDLSGNPLTELPGCLNDHAIPDVPWHGTVHDGSDDDTDEDDDDERDDALDDAPAASHGTYQGEYESPESCAIRLDASRTRIELFPADLLELKFGTIVLRGCERLRAIPAELLWMRTLDSLDCGGCSSLSELHSPERGPWESWPAQRSAAVTAAIDDRFPNIAPQLVDFSGTAFREVPRILGMDHVRCDVQCHMQGSAVERWPEGQATANLVCMRLDDTPLSELPSLAGMEWLQELSLPHRELASLPADIAQCTDLRVLFLPGLPVERYPADLSSLVSLGSLGIWGPRLTAIPAFVTTLRRLTTLALANVSLVEVPALLARCPRLSELSVQGSPLRRIDPSVLAMRTLSTLRVHGAPALDVLQFPSGCALQTLDLGIAGTVCIDPSIVNCTKLERLDLSESASAVLPDQLLGLPNLRQIAIGSSARWERLAAWIRSARPDIECIPPVDDGASEE